MELTNEFRVGVPVGTAWDVLTDVERIAPCMPGAQLEAVEGDEYRGAIKVKVGPITAQYRGSVRFLELDTENYQAIFRAEGRETRGQGNATAIITARLDSADGATVVRVNTDLTIRGRVAQFGRGALDGISVRLLNRFVGCLETRVLAAPPVDATATTPEPTLEVEAVSLEHPPSHDEATEVAASPQPSDDAEDDAQPVVEPTESSAEPVHASLPEESQPPEEAQPQEAHADENRAEQNQAEQNQADEGIPYAPYPERTVVQRLAPALALVAVGWLLLRILRRRRRRKH